MKTIIVKKAKSRHNKRRIFAIEYFNGKNWDGELFYRKRKQAIEYLKSLKYDVYTYRLARYEMVQAEEVLKGLEHT